MDDNKLIFKLCSVFLQYPNEEWVHNEEIDKCIRELENIDVRRLLMKFLAYTKELDFLQLCENYSLSFDFSDKAPLYLTYKIFGDSPERGPALVKLKEEFVAGGFPLLHDELPDFFPLVLEFASLCDGEEVNKLFKIHRKAIDLLLKELVEMDSPYQFVLQASLSTIDDQLKDRKVS